jgi:excisionase family DNA binding protein
MTAPIRLDDFSVAAIAATVAELLRGEGTDADLIDVAEVARRLGVSRDYVYRHADELGAIRLAGGPRSRVRFDPATVRKSLTGKRDEVRAPRRDIRNPVRRRSQVPLLPVKGEER